MRMATTKWSVEVLQAGDPARVALGIAYEDGFSTEPVELEVPLAVLDQGPAGVAHYFIQQLRLRYVLQQGRSARTSQPRR
jgi:hypothetical protein